MNFRKLIFVFGLILLSLQALYSQKTSSLFMTKSLKKAYAAKTRSFTGKPGPAYTLNYSFYNIDAELIPQERKIAGKEKITYFNNSSDTLKMIVIRLYQDLYKKGTARDWDLGPEDITSGVDVKSVSINGTSLDLSQRYSTLLRIFPPKPILPQSSTEIEIEWSLVLPHKRNVRMGTYGGTNFMVGYWYPKIAVYDDVYGWDTNPYTGNCEFYNDFSDYDVKVKAPAGYVLLASGLLQNKDEIFKKPLLKRLEKAYYSDDVVHVITAEDRREDKIFKNKTAVVWHFKINSLPDFAFAASNKYLWDASSVKSGERRVFINTFYSENSSDFPQIADIAAKSIRYFSEEIPAEPFPFPQLTVFNGRGGMEFPGMVNQGSSKKPETTVYITAHEIGHSYFPFYTGLNEKLYAWMDEGLITFFPRNVVAEYVSDTGRVLYAELIKSYNRLAGSRLEIPLMLPSTNTGQAYRYQAYTKPSTAFYLLEQYLGKEKFVRGLQYFISHWHGKHPTPFDFFFCMNKAAGEDLGWFWKPWFFEMSYADLSVKKNNDKSFVIENKGGVPVPVHLTIEFEDGSSQKMNLPASLWKNGNKKFVSQFYDLKIKRLVLDTVLTPDAFPKDNVAE